MAENQNKVSIQWVPTESDFIHDQSSYRSMNFDGVDGRLWYLELELASERILRLCLKSFESPDTELLVHYRFVLKKGTCTIADEFDSVIFSSTKLKFDMYRLCLPRGIHDVCSVRVDIYERPMMAQIHLGDSPLTRTENAMTPFLTFLAKSDLHDVILKVDDGEIKFHKCILSWFSPYFDDLFKSGFGENGENQIEITDFDFLTIKAMERFFYTLECPRLPVENEMNLLAAATKYQIRDLKDICEDHLISDIIVSNVVAILLHADIHSAEKVKKHALEFICENLASFENEEQFEPLIAKPTLLQELLMVMVKAKMQ